jgi:putative DNA primase/helicase
MFNTEKGPSVAGAEEKPHAKFNGSKHNSQDYIEQFREFARQKGFELPAKIVADGEKQRFGPKDACAYVLHLDGVPNGWVQDWRQGATRHQWKANGRKLNHEERERADAEIKAAKAEREADKAELHKKAAAEARRILDHETSRAPSDHPYLVKKSIRAHGVRIYTGDDPRWRDCLVIQVMRGDKLVGLQFIGPDGNKRFLPGTQKKGAYFLLGVPDDKLCICEGFGTGVTVHEAMDYAVVIAFDCHNLLAVAKAFEGFPGEVIICADNDASRVNSLTGISENIGLIRATEAACEIVDWHLNEARRFFADIAASQEERDAAKLEEWLIKTALEQGTDRISRREADRGAFGGRGGKGNRLDKAIEVLSDLGRARLIVEGNRKDIEIRPSLLGRLS